MEYKVFIHTDIKQYLGALISKYTIERYSRNLDKFSVEIILTEDLKDLQDIYGKTINYDGKEVIYSADDIQAFTLGRFTPPELMNYQGKAVVIDPDVFATYSDIWELLTLDMKDNAILCRKHGGHWGTSVMLLDCSKLKHWKLSNIVENLINKKYDYRDYMSLKNEKEQIGLLDENWNSFDKLNKDTKLLHNTQRITQPWRVGLQIDYTPKKMRPLFKVISRELIHTLVGRNPQKHRKHPDKKQEEFFFGHLKSAIIEGKIRRDMVVNEINVGHIRKDALKVLKNTKAV